MDVKPRDIEIANLAVQRGLVSRGQVDEAVADLAAKLEQSENPTTDTLSVLGVLIAKGFLKAEEVAALTGAAAAADELPADVRQAMKFPDSTYGKYIVLRLLGTGGMGAVYRAWDSGLKRYVALKFLTAGTEDNIRRFVREAQTAAHLNHPSIAQVHDAGTVHGRYFIAMEFVDGITLDRLPEGIRTSEIDKVIRMMKEVALAVDYAHSKGIVHRDLKPQNIMVDDFLKPRIMDFGLARPIATGGLAPEGGGRQITVSGTVVGTPNFISPEQARGDVEELDPRTDIYSLGATLYALVTGVPPFEGPTPLETLMQVIQDEPKPPSARNPRVPPDLERVILRCLDKEPSHRYQTAREVADELQRILSGEPILARKASITLRLRRLIRKRPTAVTLVVSAAVLVSIVSFLMTRLIRLEDERHALVQQKAAEDGHRRQSEQRKREAAQMAAAAEALVERARRMQLQNGPPSEIDGLVRTALAELTRAIQRDGLLADGYLLRAQVHSLRGSVGDAIEDLRMAFRLHPEIRTSLEQKLKRDPDSADTQETACMFRTADRRAADALLHGQRALQLDPRLKARLAPWLARARADSERPAPK